MPTCATFIQHGMRRRNHNIQIRKRNKRNPNWKGRSKIVIVRREYDTVYSLKKKLLELMCV